MYKLLSLFYLEIQYQQVVPTDSMGIMIVSDSFGPSLVNWCNW